MSLLSVHREARHRLEARLRRDCPKFHLRAVLLNILVGRDGLSPLQDNRVFALGKYKGGTAEFSSSLSRGDLFFCKGLKRDETTVRKHQKRRKKRA